MWRNPRLQLTAGGVGGAAFSPVCSDGFFYDPCLFSWQRLCYWLALYLRIWCGTYLFTLRKRLVLILCPQISPLKNITFLFLYCHSLLNFCYSMFFFLQPSSPLLVIPLLFLPLPFLLFVLYHLMSRSLSLLHTLSLRSNRKKNFLNWNLWSFCVCLFL